MKKAEVKRISDDGHQTLGILTVVKDDGQLFICKTLELPWKNNKNSVSCIPKGKYTCHYNKSSHFSEKRHHDVFTYEILNVPGRAGVRIHSANFVSDLLGCIALGDAHKDINNDGVQDVFHSGATMGAFEDLMRKEDFELVIEDAVIA